MWAAERADASLGSGALGDGAEVRFVTAQDVGISMMPAFRTRAIAERATAELAFRPSAAHIGGTDFLPVLATSGATAGGVPELVAALDAHRAA